MIGLLRRGDLEYILTAGQKLLDLVNSSEPKERVLAAQLLGEAQVPFVGPLLKLLEDKEPQVQRAPLRDNQLRPTRTSSHRAERGGGNCRICAASNREGDRSLDISRTRHKKRRIYYALDD